MAHHHEEGLRHDLERLARGGIGRRGLLSMGAMGSAALLVGCGSQDTGNSGSAMGPPPGGPGAPPQVDNGPVVTGTAADGSQCVAYTTETNGPYPADGTNQSRGSTSNVLEESGIERSDIRPSLDGGSVAEGYPMELELTLVDVNSDCTALAGYAVYVWHCDTEGKYSLYDYPEQSFLRGLQVADANGRVKFTTIVPGCYNGRYPHIHFEVFSSKDKATSGKYASLVSQLAVPSDTCDEVYATDTYAASASAWSRSKTIESDNVFGDNGEERIAAMTPEVTGSVATGFTAKAVVGIAL